MTPLVSATTYATPPSGSGDTATFDQILQPVWNVYNFIKYIATAIATVVLVYAGIMFMMSGNDMQKRDSSKQTIMYVALGLTVVWAAPFAMRLFVA